VQRERRGEGWCEMIGLIEMNCVCDLEDIKTRDKETSNRNGAPIMSRHTLQSDSTHCHMISYDIVRVGYSTPDERLIPFHGIPTFVSIHYQ
jgi:hypothetical protein